MKTVQVDLDLVHPGQRRVIEQARRFNVLQCGRRFGKSKLGLNLLIEAGIEGNPVGWFAPSYKYLIEIWEEAERCLRPTRARVNRTERRIRLSTGGTLEFWTLEDPDAGRSRRYRLAVIDEAGIVRNLEAAWQDAIRPTLTDLRGAAWFLGTPKGSNFFHRLYLRGQSGDPDWASWRMPTTANPFIDANEVEAARRDMPASAFNQEFLGIPADDGGNPFGLDAIRARYAELSIHPPAAFGVDLAKSTDWTVVVGLDEFGHVCRLERWQSDWQQTRRRVLDAVGDMPALIDSTGVGDPIVEDLARVRPTIEGFKFSSTSKQQLMEGLAAAIQRGETAFPQGWLTAELEAFEYEYRLGSVKYSAPEGLHDDGVCALALAVQKLNESRHNQIGYAVGFFGSV